MIQQDEIDDFFWKFGMKIRVHICIYINLVFTLILISVDIVCHRTDYETVSSLLRLYTHGTSYCNMA